MLHYELLQTKERFFNSDLLNLFEASIVAVGLVVILIVVTITFAPAKDDREKGSSYECGFEPFEDARTNFDVHFYIVGILFLIFDLEIAFLYPWIYSVVYNNTFYQVNLVCLFFFLTILGLGFVYEWKKKALNWSTNNRTLE
jgi:NADH-quinone oxidoreductase subunit A